MSFTTVRLIAFLILTIPFRSPAQGTIEQNAINGMATIWYFQPIGQSFTATFSQIQSIGLAFSVMNPDPNSPVTVALYSGAGFGGFIIGSVTQTVPDILPGEIPGAANFIDFNFINLNVVAGNIYTFAVTTDTVRNGLAYNRFGDAYLGGQLFESSPFYNLDGETLDLTFRITSVPEPNTIVLLLAGSATLLIMFRRKQLKQ